MKKFMLTLVGLFGLAILIFILEDDGTNRKPPIISENDMSLIFSHGAMLNACETRAMLPDADVKKAFVRHSAWVMEQFPEEKRKELMQVGVRAAMQNIKNIEDAQGLLGLPAARQACAEVVVSARKLMGDL